MATGRGRAAGEEISRQRGWVNIAAGLLMFVSGLLLISSPLLAQQYAGFKGHVTDPSGGIIIGAEFKATDEKTGISRTTLTTDVGDYWLQGVLPGTYTLEVSAKGFKTYKNTGVLVYLLQTRTVDVTLQVGEASETLNVVEQGETIQTDTASISYRTAQTEVYSLNIPSSLIYRIADNPGAESRSQVHGGFANNTNAEQDGIATNAYGSWRAPQETTQEYRQISLNAPAEYRTSTTVSGLGKSGGNQFHGEVWAQLVDTDTNALDFNQKSRPTSVNWSESYQIGGPLYIPKVYDGRNKTFFWFLFQPTPSQTTSTFHDNFIVPTAKMRLGDMSEYAAFRGITIKNPYTGQPFPNNIIPANMISPVARNINSLLPLPNNGPPGSLVNNFNWTDFNQFGSQWWQGRIDQKIGNKNNLSFVIYRYTNLDREELDGNPFPNAGFQEIDSTWAGSLQLSTSITPNLVNEAAYSFNKQHAVWTPGPIQGSDFLHNILGIDSGNVPIAGGQGSPRVIVQTLGNQLGILSGGYNPFPAQLLGSAPFAGSVDYEDGYVHQFRDNLSYVKGKHLIKTGIEVRLQKPSMLNAITGNTFGAFTFTGQYTGYDYADMMLGLPYSTGIDAVRPKVYAREWEIGGFIQDDWKITSKLTITPGLRLQHYGVPYEAQNTWYNFNVQSLTAVVPDAYALTQVVPGTPYPVITAAQAGYPPRLRNFKWMLPEPRLGIAYRVKPNTVVRMAYGIYHVPFVSSAAWATANVFGETDRAGILAGLANGPYQLSENFTPNQIVNGVPEFTLQQPFPSAQGGLQNVYSAPVSGRQSAWPYDQQWNFTIEQALPLGFTVRASYVGSKGTAWPYYVDLQTPPASTIPFTPDRKTYGAFPFNTINQFQLGGNSTHNGLELDAQRQFSSGFYLRAWFGYFKTLNDVQAGLFGSSTGNQITNPYNRSIDKGWQDGTTPYRTRIAAVWDLPVGRNQRYLGNANGVVTGILGNWTVTPFFNWYKDTTFTPTYSGADPANVGTSGGRASAICNGNDFGSGPGVIWNSACYTFPAEGTYGNASRGSLFGPAWWQFDFNVFKQFNLTKKENGPYLKFEWYCNNIFNHRNSSGPQSTNIASADFGRFIPGGYRSMYFRFRLGF